MGINDLFDIQLTAKLAGRPISTRLLQPLDFFDMEYVSSHEMSEVRCTAPWKHDHLLNYLPTTADSDGMKVQWLQLDIVDRRNTESRRVTEQHWQEHWISVDWVKKPFSEPVCVVLLQLRETCGEKSQFVKIQLNPMTYAIRGHSVVSGGTLQAPESSLFVDGYDQGPDGR
jgi:hypothetical protein